jgi:hypothetical protein
MITPPLPRSRWRAVLLLAAAGLAIGFVTGAGTYNAGVRFWSPPQHGEGHIALAYGAVFLGGPTGALIGAFLGALIGWLAWPRLGRTARVVLAGVATLMLLAAFWVIGVF